MHKHPIPVQKRTINKNSPCVPVSQQGLHEHVHVRVRQAYVAQSAALSRTVQENNDMNTAKLLVGHASSYS